MHRGKYASLDVKDGYIRKVQTKENIGQHLDLYCYTADEFNVYYDTPHIDYPENYEYIDSKGNITPVNVCLEKNGVGLGYYAIISRHKKITSIEKFFIEECNSFYSIKISKELNDLLLNIGLENLEVVKRLGSIALANLNNKNFLSNLSGNELVFFLKSSDPEVNKKLNLFRLQVMKEKLSKLTDLKIEEGTFLVFQDSIVYFSNTDKDKESLKEAIQNQKLNFVNNSREFFVNSPQEIFAVARKLELLEKYYKAYESAYLDFITRYLNTDAVLDISAECFHYGYCNENIKNYMQKILGGFDFNELL